MQLPSATLVEVPPSGQIAATAPANIAVYLGVSSKGPAKTPTPFGAQNTAGAEAIFGAGPMSREGCYMAAKVPVQFVMIRLPASAVAAVKSTPVVTKDGSSDWTSTLSGTPTDGLDVVLIFTVGGTTGISGIKYTTSTDGGVTTSAEQSLGTATTIVIGGVTINLGSGKVITAGDEATWWTQPASATILPTTITRVASSTSTMVFSGTPNDGYEIVVEFPTGGTVGQVGITQRYSLDGGRTWSTVAALALNGVLTLADGKVGDMTGITLTIGAGTVDALDRVQAKTTPPSYSWTDAAEALDQLRNEPIDWSFVVFTGYQTRAFRDSLEAKLQTFATNGRFTWGAVQGRDLITGEMTTSPGNVSGDLAWSGRIVDEWGSSIGNRTPPEFGSERCTCPVTGRRNRRPSMLSFIPRIIGTTPDTDPGDRTLPNGGALSADIAIHDENARLVEHDARVNPVIFNMGGNVLRTWYGEKGLEPGVFPSGGQLKAASGDIQRWAYRRVQDLADAASFAAMARLVSSKFGVWPTGTRPPYTPGNIMPWDLNNMQQQLFAAVYNAVAPYVSAPKTGGIVVIVNPTPAEVNGNTVVYQTTKLTGKKYLDTFVGQLGFTNPAFNALFQPA